MEKLIILLLAFFLLSGGFYWFPATKVSGNQDKGWKVWVKTSPCAGGRTDWISVAKENPTYGGGGGFWMLADQVLTPMPCTTDSDNSCSFAAANASAATIRLSSKFFNNCCRDYSVWENSQTRALAVVKGMGSAGPGWMKIKGPLCCEEAEALAGKTGLCGVGEGGGSNCFASDPAMGSANREDHYNWAQRQDAARLEANLKSKLNLLYSCPSLSDDAFANAFADFSVIIAQRASNAACFGNDQGAISTDRNAHYRWAKAISRQQLYQNLQWKMVAALKCLDNAGKKTFFADLSVPIAKTSAQATKTGGTRTGDGNGGGPPGPRPCNANETALFNKMTGSWKSIGMGPNITIGGSCERASGTMSFREYCERPDVAYNTTLKLYEVTLTGRMAGGSLQVEWKNPGRSQNGTGSCLINNDGTLSCSGVPCNVSAKKQ